MIYFSQRKKVEKDGDIMFCQRCGRQIPVDSRVCPYCGSEINNVTININGYQSGIAPKNKWVALLLCFFLGFLGIHKFYEGKILLGIVYMLTLGIFGIGVIIDFVLLLFKPNPYFP